jgi:hypothetical protein
MGLAQQAVGKPGTPLVGQPSPGDVVSGGKVLPEWGLHLIDANLVMGNLLDLIASQGQAWRMAHRGGDNAVLRGALCRYHAVDRTLGAPSANGRGCPHFLAQILELGFHRDAARELVKDRHNR